MEGNPVLAALESLLSANSRGYWRGTHEQILSAMEDFIPKGNRPKSVPCNSLSLGHWFRRESGRLRKSFGIVVGEIKKGPQKNHAREWVREIHRMENFRPNDSGDDTGDSDFI